MIRLLLARLKIEAHDVRLLVPGAVTVWVRVAGAAVDAFGCLLLGFDQFHVNDGHPCDHLRLSQELNKYRGRTRKRTQKLGRNKPSLEALQPK